MTQKISIAATGPDRQTMAGNGWLQNSVKTVATLLLLLLVLPVNITVTAIAWFAAILVRLFQSRTVAANPKTILVSGGKMTKALQLARSFDRAGHRVILI
ncbi:hypothetical protein [Microcoleus sp. herbarium14]|uniref:hypothetical protein n=1 Tax=Microcoleus sp. herbarium14 TaxID=3055439 RepID=UPI002FD26CFD